MHFFFFEILFYFIILLLFYFLKKSIAYATLGGLDGGYGLTASFFSGVLYCFFGSSPYSIIGKREKKNKILKISFKFQS